MGSWVSQKPASLGRGKVKIQYGSNSPLVKAEEVDNSSMLVDFPIGASQNCFDVGFLSKMEVVFRQDFAERSFLLGCKAQKRAICWAVASLENLG